MDLVRRPMDASLLEEGKFSFGLQRSTTSGH
jgi:hypothetical protein